MPLFGIDVSKFNGDLCFAAAKLAGVRFAFVKASQGHALSSGHYLFADSEFARNIEGFAGVGIPVGAYHFFTASTLTEACREADFFLETVAPYRDKIELYLACDAENYGNPYLQGLSRAELSSLVRAFCQRVEAAGYHACHYTNTDHLQNFIDADAVDFPVWQAHYGKAVSRPADVGARLAVHQYTGDGQLAGVPGEFDLNFGYGPLARLIIEARTPLEPQTLDYIASFASGERILICLADKLAARDLRPLRTPTHEKLVTLLRYHCALTAEEAAHLAAYRWAVELFCKLYHAMLKA